MLLFACHVAAAPSVGGIALGAQLHDRARAKTLPELMEYARPTFAWAGADMLWVMHGRDGKPRFVLNHAYQLDGSGRGGDWALFDASPSYIPSGLVEFTRQVTAGRVLAKDARRGAAYLVSWDSREKTGTGLVGCTRQIVLLHDARGRWRFIGEAPRVISGRSGPRKFRTAMEYQVRWTGIARTPVEIHATRTETTDYESDEAQPVRLQTRREYVLHGKLPGSFVRVGADFMARGRNEMLGELAMRVATCKTFYPQERRPERRKKMLGAVRAAIARLNPHSGGQASAGARILLPDMDQIWNLASDAGGPRRTPDARLSAAEEK